MFFLYNMVNREQHIDGGGYVRAELCPYQTYRW